MEGVDTRALFDSSIAVSNQSADGLPPGEEIADAICDLLRRSGFTVSGTDATPAMWFFDVHVEGGIVGIEVASNRAWAPVEWPEWSLLLGKLVRRGFAANLFRRAASPGEREAFQALVRRVHEVLVSDMRFSRVGWLASDEWRPDSIASPRPSPRLG